MRTGALRTLLRKEGKKKVAQKIDRSLNIDNIESQFRHVQGPPMSPQDGWVQRELVSIEGGAITKSAKGTRY